MKENLENQENAFDNDALFLEPKSSKSYIVCLLLCVFLGSFGVHRFYVGKLWTGLLMLVTFGGLGIWLVIDFILIVSGYFKDEFGLSVKN
ncbi:MAG: TM2 domain-containing protein [Marinifilaceae bacterium]|jgi:TM2 domain-containing membrane protein YozV|nr:TM2 domain-containing protein [Marinifilaceae bacterium]